MKVHAHCKVVIRLITVKQYQGEVHIWRAVVDGPYRSSEHRVGPRGTREFCGVIVGIRATRMPHGGAISASSRHRTVIRTLLEDRLADYEKGRHLMGIINT